MLLLSELSELKSAELWVLWTRVPVCRTDGQCLFNSTYNPKRRKTRCCGQGLENETCIDLDLNKTWKMDIDTDLDLG